MTKLRGFTFVTTLVLVLKMIKSENRTKYDIFYSHSETTINKSAIGDNAFTPIYIL